MDILEPVCVASSTKASIAPRATPKALAAFVDQMETMANRRLNNGPGCFASSSMEKALSVGTKTSSSVKSLLPVPRIPSTRQTSRTWTLFIGNTKVRVSWTPVRLITGPAASTTLQVHNNHLAWSPPLTKSQRPLTR